jgi:hypothetical protein
MLRSERYFEFTTQLTLIFRSGSLTLSKALNTSQQITVVGLGSTAFRDALSRLRDIHGLFVRHFPVGSVSNWASEEEPVLNASNRYFVCLSEYEPVLNLQQVLYVARR